MRTGALARPLLNFRRRLDWKEKKNGEKRPKFTLDEQHEIRKFISQGILQGRGSVCVRTGESGAVKVSRSVLALTDSRPRISTLLPPLRSPSVSLSSFPSERSGLSQAWMHTVGTFLCLSLFFSFLALLSVVSSLRRIYLRIFIFLSLISFFFFCNIHRACVSEYGRPYILLLFLFSLFLFFSSFLVSRSNSVRFVCCHVCSPFRSRRSLVVKRRKKINIVERAWARPSLAAGATPATPRAHRAHKFEPLSRCAPHSKSVHALLSVRLTTTRGIIS